MESASYNQGNEASRLWTLLLLAAATADTSVQTSGVSTLDRTIFYGVFLLLLFGPLAFGAVESWSIFVLEAGATLLSIVWTIRQAVSGELSVTGNATFAPMLVFLSL